MKNTCTSIIQYNSVKDFIGHVMTRFSQWSGVNVGYLFNMFEISGDEDECLDVIEDCLRKFGKLENESDDFPWHDTTVHDSTFSYNISITMECNILLNELDEIRSRKTGETVYGT